MTSCTCTCTALVALREGVPVCSACGAKIGGLIATTPRPYSQLDGERPAGCGRARYLRTWRRARDAGDAGATTDGRARLLSADAYARHAVITRRPARVIPIRSIDDDVMRELGLASGAP